MSVINDYLKTEVEIQKKKRENPDYQLNKDEIKAHYTVAKDEELSDIYNKISNTSDYSTQMKFVNDYINNNKPNEENSESIPYDNPYISTEVIEAELEVMNAKVNDINGLKKQIEKIYNNPELLDNIDNNIEKEFYEKMVQIYGDNKEKELSKTNNETLKLNLTNKEAGFISLVYVSSLLLFLLFLFFALK